MTAELVLASRPAEGVLLLTLNRPDKLNAFNLAMRNALEANLASAAADADIRAVVIAGSEKAFVAGADLAAVANATVQDMEGAGLHHIWDALDSYPKPIVMAVSGYCFGAGCELMIHGDIIVVARHAQIGLPEITVGIQPGAGGLSRLVRSIGYHRAVSLALTGKPISGAQAADWGMATHVADSGEVMQQAIALATRVARMPGDRTASIRAVARRGLDLPLSEQMQNERRAYWGAFGTADQREGMAAFLDKRKPAFNQAE